MIFNNGLKTGLNALKQSSQRGNTLLTKTEWRKQGYEVRHDATPSQLRWIRVPCKLYSVDDCVPLQRRRGQRRSAQPHDGGGVS